MKMDNVEQNQIFHNDSITYLNEQIEILKSMLSYALNLPVSEIKISFPSLDNFYYLNKVYKSSWAIYIHKDKLPQLLYTGNFLIQGGSYTQRSNKSPFGAKAFESLVSIANTFSQEASTFKQNWTMDLNLFEEDGNKLAFTVKEYQDFLKLLNTVRGRWLLHLSEEANCDFVISEFSEPSDSVFFIDLENIDSSATKIKTYFKLVSENALNLFRTLSGETEFEGRFYNLQPGMWTKDDVLLEMEKLYSNKFHGDNKDIIIRSAQMYDINNPFKIQALKPSY